MQETVEFDWDLGVQEDDQDYPVLLCTDYMA
jgi:hypothetical protein